MKVSSQSVRVRDDALVAHGLHPKVISYLLASPIVCTGFDGSGIGAITIVMVALVSMLASTLILVLTLMLSTLLRLVSTPITKLDERKVQFFA